MVENLAHFVLKKEFLLTVLSNLEREAGLETQIFDRLIIDLNIVDNKFD